jgi:hypothetical protein
MSREQPLPIVKVGLKEIDALLARVEALLVGDDFKLIKELLYAGRRSRVSDISSASRAARSARASATKRSSKLRLPRLLHKAIRAPPKRERTAATRGPPPAPTTTRTRGRSPGRARHRSRRTSSKGRRR